MKKHYSIHNNTRDYCRTQRRHWNKKCQGLLTSGTFSDASAAAFSSMSLSDSCSSSGNPSFNVARTFNSFSSLSNHGSGGAGRTGCADWLSGFVPHMAQDHCKRKTFQMKSSLVRTFRVFIRPKLIIRAKQSLSRNLYMNLRLGLDT